MRAGGTVGGSPGAGEGPGHPGPMQQCEQLLIEMMCRADARYFNKKVPNVKAMLFHPLVAPKAAAEQAERFARTDHIDLATIAARLRLKLPDYGPEDFARDVRRVLATATVCSGLQDCKCWSCHKVGEEPPAIKAGRRLGNWFEEAFGEACLPLGPL